MGSLTWMLVMPSTDTQATRFHCPHRHHDPLIESRSNPVAVIREFPLSDGGAHAIEVWVQVPYTSIADNGTSRLLRACFYGEASRAVH